MLNFTLNVTANSAFEVERGNFNIGWTYIKDVFTQFFCMVGTCFYILKWQGITLGFKITGLLFIFFLGIVSTPIIVLSEIRQCFNECAYDASWSWYMQPFPWWSFFFAAPLFGLFHSAYQQYPIRSEQTLNMVKYTTITFYITRTANLRIMNIDPTPAMIAVCLSGSFSMGLYYARNRQSLLVLDKIHAVIQVLVLESAATAYRARMKPPLSQDEIIFNFFILFSVFFKVKITQYLP